MSKWGVVIGLCLLLTGCGFFNRPIVVSHIPPSLTQLRLVHGCEAIENASKLASCYIKTREALYLANEDKKSLNTLEDKIN